MRKRPPSMPGTRTQTQHYCYFNLQSWANLAALCERCGLPLWEIGGSDGRGLRDGFAWLSPFVAGAEWHWPLDPHDGIPPFWALGQEPD